MRVIREQILTALARLHRENGKQEDCDITPYLRELRIEEDFKVMFCDSKKESAVIDTFTSGSYDYVKALKSSNCEMKNLKLINQFLDFAIQRLRWDGKKYCPFCDNARWSGHGSYNIKLTSNFCHYCKTEVL